MSGFIHSTKNNIHIIDLTKTLPLTQTALDFLVEAGRQGSLLFVGTKRQASKIVRQQPELKDQLLNNVSGNEVAFGSIGDASTSEGIFFETINAAGVLRSARLDAGRCSNQRDA